MHKLIFLSTECASVPLQNGKEIYGSFTFVLPDSDALPNCSLCYFYPNYLQDYVVYTNTGFGPLAADSANRLFILSNLPIFESEVKIEFLEKDIFIVKNVRLKLDGSTLSFTNKEEPKITYLKKNYSDYVLTKNLTDYLGDIRR